MNRVALGAAWLLATIAGGFLTIEIQFVYSTPLIVGLLIGNLPAAVLLAFLVNRREWALIVGLGWLAIAVLEHYAVTPALTHLVTPLAPARDPIHFSVPPRSAYLPEWVAYSTSFGLVQGALTAALLWWYLRSQRLWVLLWAAAGFLNALTGAYLQWLLPVPVPGSTPGVNEHAGLYIVGPLLVAVGVALLWRFEADPPVLKSPQWARPAPKDPPAEAAEGYGGWMEELEESL